MKTNKDITHAFVVRIWVESREMKNAEPIWRGVIEDVHSGRCIYFDQLEKISTYFAKYLDGIGMKHNNARE